VGMWCMLMCVGSELYCGWLSECSCTLSMADRICVGCMQKLYVEYMTSAGSVWYVGV